MLVPPPSTALQLGDRILFCGISDARSAINISINHSKALNYIVDGIEVPDSVVWRWFRDRLKK
jgi:hypothetical protein